MTTKVEVESLYLITGKILFEHTVTEPQICLVMNIWVFFNKYFSTKWETWAQRKATPPPHSPKESILSDWSYSNRRCVWNNLAVRQARQFPIVSTAESYHLSANGRSNIRSRPLRRDLHMLLCSHQCSFSIFTSTSNHTEINYTFHMMSKANMKCDKCFKSAFCASLNFPRHLFPWFFSQVER